MTPERQAQIKYEGGGPLTAEELREGWHYCADWDYELVGPNSVEITMCTCLPHDHPAKAVCCDYVRG